MDRDGGRGRGGEGVIGRVEERERDWRGRGTGRRRKGWKGRDGGREIEGER